MKSALIALGVAATIALAAWGATRLLPSASAEREPWQIAEAAFAQAASDLQDAQPGWRCDYDQVAGGRRVIVCQENPTAPTTGARFSPQARPPEPVITPEE